MTFVGVDGCKAGWLAVALNSGDGWTVGVFPNVAALWAAHREAALILVDIPIGLREDRHPLHGPARECDREARKLLKRPRASSVFPVPCRQAVHAKSSAEAGRINERELGNKIPVQALGILTKIRAVDELLLSDAAARRRLREVHPEVCFCGLAGHAMKHGKKKLKGFQERRGVLAQAFPGSHALVAHALSLYRRKEVARDDILDALVAAVTARFGHANLVTLPREPERDSRGLPMEMVYWPRHPACTQALPL